MIETISGGPGNDKIFLTPNAGAFGDLISLGPGSDTVIVSGTWRTLENDARIDDFGVGDRIVF